MSKLSPLTATFALLSLCICTSFPAYATPEPLEPVPFSHTVKIAYGYSLTEQAATVIAEAFALHGAFTRASQWIEHRQQIARGSETTPALAAREETIAANQLYKFHRSKIFRSKDIDGNYINVEVTISPIEQFDEKHLLALKPTSRAKIFEAIFMAEESYLQEFSTKTFNDKQHTFLLSLNANSKFFFDNIANRLRALKAYRKLVPEYTQGTWKNPKQKLKEVSLLLNSAPEEPILLHAKGSILFQLKNTIEAIRYFNDAIDLEPNIVVALHDRGTAYVRANLPDMALVDYDKAILLSPNNPHLYISHGSADLVLKDYESMCKHYRKGCSLGLCNELNWGIARGMCKK
ncbi:tetratricopeptide repeat protein [Halodesulfovibrio aestuarii]|uniref:Tetratricopeptide repeat protein n=1 Tax=Halodesulfovibrio aestuarii TaxID=126333 RepID=A0ABV4JSF9_9BACT